MIPVFQAVIDHNPEEGRYGDCLRACLASILELALEQVPHFANEREYGSDWYVAMNAWLAERFDVCYVNFPVKEDEFLEHCRAMEHYRIDALHLLGGYSGRSAHVVVARCGKVVHDPWPKLDSPWRGFMLPDPDTKCFEFGIFAKRYFSNSKGETK